MYTYDTTVDVWAPTYDLVASKLNAVLARLYTWCCENCLTPHPTKTEYMLLSGRRQFIIIIKYHRTSRCVRPPRCLTNPSRLDPALFRSLSRRCVSTMVLTFQQPMIVCWLGATMGPIGLWASGWL